MKSAVGDSVMTSDRPSNEGSSDSISCLGLGQTGRVGFPGSLRRGRSTSRATVCSSVESAGVDVSLVRSVSSEARREFCTEARREFCSEARREFCSEARRDV
jgi:hypothetical protein